MRAAPRPPGTLGWPQCSVYRNPAVYTVSNTSEKPRGPSPPPSFEWRNDSGDTRNIGNKGLAWIRVRRPRALLQAFLPPGRYVKASCIHDIGVGLPLATLYTRGLCGIPLSVVWALWRRTHRRACVPSSAAAVLQAQYSVCGETTSNRGRPRGCGGARKPVNTVGGVLWASPNT
jgi:hypothetical protein